METSQLRRKETDRMMADERSWQDLLRDAGAELRYADGESSRQHRSIALQAARHHLKILLDEVELKLGW